GDAGRVARQAQSCRMPDELAERHATCTPLERWAASVLDVSATRLDDAPIRHARRAYALACTAAETQVDVLDLLLVEWHSAALPLRHQVDAPARRLGLEAGDPKRGARVEAQPTVHAGREIVVRQSLERHTRYRPGLRMPSGSKACLSRRMTPIVGGGVPHAPT